MATPFSPAPLQPARRRRFGRWRLLFVVFLLLAAMGFGTLATNAFGMGERFERLVDRVARIVDPPPDRASRPTVTVTPRPSLSPTPAPSPSATAAGASPSAAPTPSPLPAREPVDVSVVPDPDAVFAHQIDKDWCAPSGIQMTLAALGLADTSAAFQRELVSRVREWESREDSLNGKWGPVAIALALEAYGAPGYEIRAYEFRGDALRDAAIAIRTTGAPVVLLTWRGAHTWVMTGYRADADPTIFPDAVVEGTYILDPWYPDVSSIWGPSDPPGTFQDDAEMRRNFLPWKRPEGRYPDRDGKWIIVVPTIPIG